MTTSNHGPQRTRQGVVVASGASRAAGREESRRLTQHPFMCTKFHQWFAATAAARPQALTVAGQRPAAFPLENVG